MAIPLEDYEKIHSRPNRPTGGFEEGPEFTEDDGAILDRVWAASAKERGIEQLPNQPTKDEIRNYVPTEKE